MGTTKFIWVTKGNKEEFYRFDKDKNKKNTETDIPYFGESDTKKYKYAKGGVYTDKVKGKDTAIKTGDLKAVTESELTRLFKQAHDALWAGRWSILRMLMNDPKDCISAEEKAQKTILLNGTPALRMPGNLQRKCAIKSWQKNACQLN